jgi:hypothetical protein
MYVSVKVRKTPVIVAQFKPNSEYDLVVVNVINMKFHKKPS